MLSKFDSRLISFYWLNMFENLSRKLKAIFNAGTQKPEIGMTWDCFGVLHVDAFQIIGVNDDNTVDIIETGWPRGSRIEQVKWPEYLDTIRSLLPRHNHLKYLGVKPVTDEKIQAVKEWQEMKDEPRPLDF